MRNIFASIRKIPLYLKTLCLEAFKNGQVVKMSAFFNPDGSVQHLNWGDDINHWFLNTIAVTPIVSYDWSLLTRIFRREYVMGIGSLLTLVPLDNSIIWGTGIMSSTAPFRGKPKEIRAVRGPLTRQRLIEAGIDCPAVYGDPALLLPMIYMPKHTKTHKLGIIPHYNDVDNELFDNLKDNKEVLFINVRHYDNWLDFIDEICSCEYIASTSLHGLIVSEAYGVPNLWIKLPTRLNEDDVKFHDFFLSIGTDRIPFIINGDTTTSDLIQTSYDYKKGHIDLKPLIEACPLNLNFNATIRRLP